MFVHAEFLIEVIQTQGGAQVWRLLCTAHCGSQAVMFHPPKIPQRQRNSNGTGFQWVLVENPLNADVAPIADPFF